MDRKMSRASGLLSRIRRRIIKAEDEADNQSAPVRRIPVTFEEFLRTEQLGFIRRGMTICELYSHLDEPPWLADYIPVIEIRIGEYFELNFRDSYYHLADFRFHDAPISSRRGEHNFPAPLEPEGWWPTDETHIDEVREFLSSRGFSFDYGFIAPSAPCLRLAHVHIIFDHTRTVEDICVSDPDHWDWNSPESQHEWDVSWKIHELELNKAWNIAQKEPNAPRILIRSLLMKWRFGEFEPTDENCGILAWCLENGDDNLKSVASVVLERNCARIEPVWIRRCGISLLRFVREEQRYFPDILATVAPYCLDLFTTEAEGGTSFSRAIAIAALPDTSVVSDESLNWLVDELGRESAHDAVAALEKIAHDRLNPDDLRRHLWHEEPHVVFVVGKILLHSGGSFAPIAWKRLKSLLVYNEGYIQQEIMDLCVGNPEIHRYDMGLLSGMARHRFSGGLRDYAFECYEKILNEWPIEKVDYDQIARDVENYTGRRIKRPTRKRIEKALKLRDYPGQWQTLVKKLQMIRYNVQFFFEDCYERVKERSDDEKD